MTSSSDLFKGGKLRVASFFATSQHTVGSKLYGEVVDSLKHQHAEVHELSLLRAKLNACDGCYSAGGRVCLMPCDHNDVEADIYDPTDKGVIVHEKVTECDLLFVAAEARCGGLDSSTQRFLERLLPYENLAQRKGQHLLRGKVAMCLVVGDGAEGAVGLLVARLSALGFTIPAKGSCSVEVPKVTREAGLKLLESNSRLREDLRTGVDAAVRLVHALKAN